MNDPRPVTPVQLAALVSYMTACVYFMTRQDQDAPRLMAAKARMEAAFGVKMPYPGEEAKPQSTFPDIL